MRDLVYLIYSLAPSLSCPKAFWDHMEGIKAPQKAAGACVLKIHRGLVFRLEWGFEFRLLVHATPPPGSPLPFSKPMESP